MNQQNSSDRRGFMSHFMVEIELPAVLSDEFINTIPYQREHINQLMTRKVVASYSLDIHRSKVWVTVIGNDETFANDIISGFPLARFMSWTIYELAFYNSVALTFPDISVN